MCIVHVSEQIITSIRHSARTLVREFGFFQTHYANTEATHGETHVLIELLRLGSLEVGELARILNMEKTSASKMLAHMENKDWLLVGEGQDGRKKIYSLSSLGKELAIKIEKIASIRMKAAMSELAGEDVQKVVEALSTLSSALRISRARSHFKVRECKASDDKAIASIVKRSLKDLGFAGPGTAAADASVNYLSTFNGPRSCYLVAEQDGKVLGGAGVVPMVGEKKNVCELVRMFLHPEARSTGIAQILIEEVLSRAKTFGYRICYLETTEKMQAAQRLYLKNGFYYVKSRRGNTGHFACSVLMEKVLEK